MRFISVIAATSLLAQGALSLKFNDFEVSEAPTGLVLTDVIEVDKEDGAKDLVSIYHGLDGDKSARDFKGKDSLRLNKRCGSNRSECHQDGNGAWDKSCYDLLDWLKARDSTPLRPTPRSVCYTSRDTGGIPQKDYQCCVSWSQDTTTALAGDLRSAARNAMRDCVWHDSNNNKHWVSARTLDVKLGQTCLTQCLSNRPTGCN